MTATITRSDRLDGFFVQAPDDAADNDPTTSEGIYVFCGTSCPPSGVLARRRGAGRRPGRRVRHAAERGRRRHHGDHHRAWRRRRRRRHPPAADGDPDRTARRGPDLQCRHVRALRRHVDHRPATLTVSELFQQAQFGELELMAGGRPYTFTQLATPTTPAMTTTWPPCRCGASCSTTPAMTPTTRSSAPPTSPTSSRPRPLGRQPGPRRRHDRRADRRDAVGLQPVAAAPGGRTGLHVHARPTSGHRQRRRSPAGWARRVQRPQLLRHHRHDAQHDERAVRPVGHAGLPWCRQRGRAVAQLAKIVASLKDIDADVVGLTEIENDTGLATGRSSRR